MTNGEMMIYIGIGLIAVSFTLLVVLAVVFAARKKKVIKKIYSENE